MSGKTVRSAFGATAMTLALSLYASLADASVIYQWVCGAPDCDGDTAFTSSIETPTRCALLHP